MNSTFFPFNVVAFNPHGMAVGGKHSPEPMKVAEIFEKGLPEAWKSMVAEVLALPGGFDGDRAVIYGWETAGRKPGHDNVDSLTLKSGFRTYTEGAALREMVATQIQAAPGCAPGCNSQPPEGWCWGGSLATIVLLPYNTVLCGRRADNMHKDPGLWSCVFTETLEPSDIEEDMTPLLNRLIQEEIPALSALGDHRFVGMVCIPHAYAHVLVSVLDLRSVDKKALRLAMAGLQPDAETSAWGLQVLDDAYCDKEAFDLVRYVVGRLPEVA